jgi:hypothetical protein
MVIHSCVGLWFRGVDSDQQLEICGQPVIRYRVMRCQAQLPDGPKYIAHGGAQADGVRVEGSWVLAHHGT